MKYTFVVEGRISLHCEVEASTLEDAIAKAQQASIKSLCYQCARTEDDEWGTSGELDCDPAISELVEVVVDGEIEDEVLEKAKEQWG